MIRHALGCALFLCWASSGNAQQIYKCVSSNSVTYQSAPCASASTFVASAAQSSRTGEPSADSTPACATRPEPPSRLPFRRREICIGMTDDEVLNLAGWGRPARISRTRAPREWRETWAYGNREGAVRQLRFVNGKLATVETDGAEPQLGSLASLKLN